MPHNVQIIDSGKAMILTGPDNYRARFHAVWLRDNALDPATRSEVNGQKLITLGDFAADITLDSVKMVGDCVEVSFEQEVKTTVFPLHWLQSHTYDRTHPARYPGWVGTDVSTWDRDSVDICRSPLNSLREDPCALQRWLESVVRHGFAMAAEGSTKSGALLDVVNLFGFVRETNYGQWFEVRTEVNPTNLAYTGLGLQGHTDNPYRDPVPTLQLLYCLENSTLGGESILIDGFRVAEKLKAEMPEGFELLSRYCARFEYAGSADVCLQARRPMIELTPDGEMIAIRFNNRSAAPILDVPYEDMESYYRAYRRFGELVDDPCHHVHFKLSPGECVLFDNTRILHSRTAFSGQGSRWLQGCYADLDGLRSTLQALRNNPGNIAS